MLKNSTSFEVQNWTVSMQHNIPQRRPLRIPFATLRSTYFCRRGHREQTSDVSRQLCILNFSVRLKAFAGTKFFTSLAFLCSVVWALGLCTFWQITWAIFSSQMNLTMRFWGSHSAKETIEMKLFLLALIQWWNTYRSNPLLQSRFIARRGKWGTWKDQNNDRKKWMDENPSSFTHYRLPGGTKYCRPMTTKPDSLLQHKT